MMNLLIALMAPGHMGAAIGKRLTEHGVTVLTSLEGRSKASRARAAAAGLSDVPAAKLMQADLFLSILPPKAAPGAARALAPLLQGADRKPLYVDCNAVSPATVRQIAAGIEAAGASFVDGGIIGPPPGPGSTPRLYVSGPHAHRVEPLNRFGLDVRIVEGVVGAASALKLSYAGINKGLIGLASAMVLAAKRAGVEDALKRELSESQRALLGQLSRGVPDMFSKAERWAPEMAEIAEYVGPGGEAMTFAGMSELYGRLAEDFAGARDEINALEQFFVADKGST